MIELGILPAITYSILIVPGKARLKLPIVTSR